MGLCLYEEGSLTFGSPQDPHILEHARLGKIWAFKVGWGELPI